MKLIVISIDALGYSDIKKHRGLLKNFNRICESGSMIENVQTIMPSVTYPVHTSIITGEFPSVHGIDHNIYFQPFEKHLEWNWYYDKIKCPTIIDAVNANKQSVTTLFWPVTAGVKIKNSLPEIWDHKKGKPSVRLLFKYGSPLFLLKAFKYRKHLDGFNNQSLDNFSIAMLNNLIETNLSDLTLVHLLAIDEAKHDFGNDSKECLNAIVNTDKHIGKIFDKVSKLDDVSLVVLSDHSHIDAHTLIDLEAEFKKNELLFSDEYIAYPRSCEGSCYVHLKNSEDHEMVKQKLVKIVENIEGLDALYDLKIEQNISCDANFMIGVKPGYTIGKKLKHIGVHGHDPKFDHDVFMVVFGKNIKQNYKVKSGHVVNHANTFAKILGVNFNSQSGECVNEIFKKL